MLLRNGSCVFAAGVLGVGAAEGDSPEQQPGDVPPNPRVAVWSAMSGRWRALDGLPAGSAPAGGPIAALARNGSSLIAVGAFLIGEEGRCE